MDGLDADIYFLCGIRPKTPVQRSNMSPALGLMLLIVPEANVTCSGGLLLPSLRVFFSVIWDLGILQPTRPVFNAISFQKLLLSTVRKQEKDKFYGSL